MTTQIETSQSEKSSHVTGIPKRAYAWKPDVPDHRDRIYSSLTTKSWYLTSKVDRIGIDNPIEDQGSLGSCTGNASTSMLEIALGIAIPHSRLMAYYNGRVIDGTTRTDAGAQIRNVIKGLVKNGVCYESNWKYIKFNLTRKPNKLAVENGSLVAEQIKTMKLAYYRVDDLKGLLTALSRGRTVTFGFTVTSAIDRLPKTGILQLPKANSPSLGGHAVLAVGYDHHKQFVWVRNSWGKDWGLNGYFKMPFAWFTDPRRLVDDMWTLE